MSPPSCWMWWYRPITITSGWALAKIPIYLCNRTKEKMGNGWTWKEWNQYIAVWKMIPLCSDSGSRFCWLVWFSQPLLVHAVTTALWEKYESFAIDGHSHNSGLCIFRFSKTNKQTNSLVCFFEPFDLWGHRKCPHRPRSCSNTRVFIHICPHVLINHINLYTHSILRWPRELNVQQIEKTPAN